MMTKLRRSKGFCIRFGCRGIGTGSGKGQQEQRECNNESTGNSNSEVKWELRPGGMLVQKRECLSGTEASISIRVSAVSQLWHDDISIAATSTFGELKMVISLVTGLDPKEQRLLFKGKEREDNEFLHMVGVRDRDKVLLLEDPAIKEMKLQGINIGHNSASCQTISV